MLVWKNMQQEYMYIDEEGVRQPFFHRLVGTLDALIRDSRYSADYALRVLMHLAARPERLSSIGEMARTNRISQNHLMKVAFLLGREHDAADPVLARRLAFFRHFDAMVDEDTSQVVRLISTYTAEVEALRANPLEVVNRIANANTRAYLKLSDESLFA